jgi:pyruvate dehydrogenase E1 component alpha subunit
MLTRDSEGLERGDALCDSVPLTDLFRSMMRIRVAEETIADLVEQNEIRCPTHLCIGQEGVAAGVCVALRQDDYVFGGHRSHGHYLAKGGDLRAFMAELFGKTTGCSRGLGGSMHLFAEDVGILGTVPLVAATIPIAVGSALASKLRKDSRVSVAFFGDGATAFPVSVWMEMTWSSCIVPPPRQFNARGTATDRHFWSVARTDGVATSGQRWTLTLA